MRRGKKYTILVILLIVMGAAGYYSATHFLAQMKIKKNLEVLQSSLAGMRLKQPPRISFFGKTRRGDGGPDLLKAVAEAAKLINAELLHELEKLTGKSPDKKVIENTKVFLSKSWSLQDRVYAALEKEKVLVPLDFVKPDNTPAPEAFRALGIAMIMRGRESRENGDHAEAMRWFLTAARYGQDFSRHAPLKYREAGAETTIRAINESFLLLYRKNFRSNDLRRYLKAVESLETLEPDFNNNLQAEQYSGEYRLHEISRNIGFFPTYITLPGVGTKNITTLALHSRSWDKYKTWFETARMRSKGPYPAARQSLTGHIANRILGNEMVRAMTWDFENTYRQHTLSLAFCRAFKFLLWLRVFRAENGRYPRESIEELADGHPLDPFTDNKKFYYMNSFGETRFYSVGSDMTHNNGDGKMWEDNGGFDIVFPVRPMIHAPK
ncbi:MAG: hypothetical protein ACYS8W_02555 [Planctomycetota bacterium]|jgi:hypothetical protein